MKRALQLAARGQGRVEPNPMVGSVIVRRGQIIGEGYHRRFGGPHAEIEALEEAGALGEIAREKIGQYTYKKKLGKGVAMTCEVDVYPMMVDRLKSNWKERKERKRKWFSARSAAKRVSEPKLAELLRSIAKKPAKQPVIREFLKAS